MHTRRDLVRLWFAAPSIILPFSGTTFAQIDDYPNHYITTVCTFAPGSGADIFVRFYARKLQELIGPTVIVENKVGMAGNIGAESVARSKPDGYTILIAPSSILAAGPHLFKKLNYDPINDFGSVTTLFKLPFVLIVPPDVGINSVSDLTARLKQKGENAFYGSSTLIGLVASELYKAQFGLVTTEVKYKGGAITDLLARHLDFLFTDPVTVKEMIASGRVKALAVTSAQRIAALPGLPGALDAGIKNMDLISWWSVHVPAKTPRPIVDKLVAWFNQIAASDDARKFLANLGADPLPGSPQLVDQMLATEARKWSEYVKLAKIEPQ